MEFGSAQAYLSKRKIEKLQHRDKAPEPMQDIPAPLSTIKEEDRKVQDMEEEKEKGKSKPKSRSRSGSCSSISDEELDKFDSSSSSEEEEAEEKEKEKEKEKEGREKEEEEGFRGSRGGRGGARGGFRGRGRGSVGYMKKSQISAPRGGKAKPAAPKWRKKAKLESASQEEREVLGSALSAASGNVGVKHKQEVDTNVLSINLSVLKDKTALATGDPVFCGKCKAVFNTNSKLEMLPAAPDKQQWTCEFCNNLNSVSIEKEELPQSDELTYVLESAPQAMGKKEESKALAEDISLIFCIDVSGSMCVTQAVEGKAQMKYDKTDKLKDFMKFSDGSYQYMTNENRNVTYVSRMQCVQTAIEKQLVDLSNGAPNRKVGIVTFNSDVTLIGDGLLPPKVIAGDKLSDYEALLKIGSEEGAAYVTKGVKDTKASLVARLGTIEESGQTALGPALVVALGLAMKGKPGSRVILCTDGLANVGLGPVETLASKAAFDETSAFYKKVGELAKSKGVSISLISIVGDECRLEMLSPLADLTAGDILKVDPLNLAADFANILSEAVIATNVEVRMKLHKGLTFRNESATSLAEDQTLLVRHVGNATDHQEITFEYCMKDTEELSKMADIDFTKVSKLPFQTQIAYTTLDGMRCMRLITKTQNVTFEREQAKKAANYSVLSVNAVQQSAKMASDGRLRDAQANAQHWRRLMKGSDKYADYAESVKPLYEALQMQQVQYVAQDRMEAMPAMKAKMSAPAPQGKTRSLGDKVVSLTNKANRFHSKKK